MRGDNIKMNAKKPKAALAEKIDLASRIEALNKEYSIVMRGSQVLIMRCSRDEDGKFKYSFLNRRDFQLFMENQRVRYESESGAVKFIPLAKSWLESPLRTQYDGVYFYPGENSQNNLFNFWRGFDVKPDNTKSCELFLKHVFDNICGGNEEYYNWTIDWLADLVQNPAQKSGTAVVLRGEMGIGKGTFANYVGEIFGTHYMPITQGSQITGRFNGHMTDKMLIFIDESGWSQDKNGAGTLRALITEKQVTFEMKGRDAVPMDNFTRFIIAANADWVVPVGMQDERRFVLFDVANTYQRDTKYWSAIHQEMNNGGPEALLYFLLNHKYDKESLRSIPHTAGLLEQKFNSMTVEIKWWADCLTFEKIGDLNFPEGNLEMIMETERFYKSYSDFCHQKKIPPCDKRALPVRLKKFVVLKKSREGLSTDRVYLYTIECLNKCRANFEAAVGQIIHW